MPDADVTPAATETAAPSPAAESAAPAVSSSPSGVSGLSDDRPGNHEVTPDYLRALQSGAFVTGRDEDAPATPVTPPAAEAATPPAASATPAETPAETAPPATGASAAETAAPPADTLAETSSEVERLRQQLLAAEQEAQLARQYRRTLEGLREQGIENDDAMYWADVARQDEEYLAGRREAIRADIQQRYGVLDNEEAENALVDAQLATERQQLQGRRAQERQQYEAQTRQEREQQEQFQRLVQEGQAAIRTAAASHPVLGISIPFSVEGEAAARTGTLADVVSTLFELGAAAGLDAKPEDYVKAIAPLFAGFEQEIQRKAVADYVARQKTTKADQQPPVVTTEGGTGTVPAAAGEPQRRRLGVFQSFF